MKVQKTHPHFASRETAPLTIKTKNAVSVYDCSSLTNVRASARLVGGGAAASKPVQTNNFDYNKSLHPQEVLGRSQVNFTGESFKFSENDRKFLDSAASNLRLSEKDKKILEDTTISYLKANNQDSFDYLEDDNKAEEQGEYCEYIGKALDFSDNDFNIFTADFIQRVCYYYDDEKYEPLEHKYDKDFEVVDHIFEKYDIGMNTKFTIFNTMKMEAEALSFDTVFDLFKNENEPQNSVTYQIISRNIGKDVACNMLLDFVNAASKDQEKRHSEVDNTKLQRMFRNFQGDIVIIKTIAENFGIDNENILKDMMSQLEKRRTEDKDISQIAFELADKYQLPSGAEEFIKNVVINIDHINDLLMNRK